MVDGHREKRVNCRLCRYRFLIRVAQGEDWRVEAQCPSCEAWACFTIADTHDSPKPDLRKLEVEAQRLGEQLWRPINEHHGHPAVAWVDRVGNGVFEDDYSLKPWPIPTLWVYRFRRGNKAAYIWQEGEFWLVRRWHPLRDSRQPPEPIEVFSFEAALDRLVG